MSYDPDPGRRRRHKGPRKGVEPAGLKRWRLAQKRTHDPSAARRRKPWHRGPRGGKYWKGPTTRRYDPGVRSRVSGYITRHPRIRRIGGKAENFINQYGGWLGALLAGLAGVYNGYQHHVQINPDDPLKSYTDRIIGADGRQPEVMMAILPTPEVEWNQLDYLKYKFLGIDLDGKYIGSAWVIPFWASLIGFIASKLPIPIPSWARIRRPLGKIAAPALIVSTIGALALPGSEPTRNSASSSKYGNRINYVYGK